MQHSQYELPPFPSVLCKKSTFSRTRKQPKRRNLSGQLLGSEATFPPVIPRANPSKQRFEGSKLSTFSRLSSNCSHDRTIATQHVKHSMNLNNSATAKQPFSFENSLICAFAAPARAKDKQENQSCLERIRINASFMATRLRKHTLLR